MEKAVSLEAGGRGGARPGAGRGLLTDPAGPEPSRDPRLRQLSANPLVTLSRAELPGGCPQTQRLSPGVTAAWRPRGSLQRELQGVGGRLGPGPALQQHCV